MVNLRLEQTLDDWSAWPLSKRPTLVKSFTSGLSHQAFLLSDTDRLVVLKLFKQPQRAAIKIQRWAATRQLAPSVIFASKQAHYMVTDYLPRAADTDVRLSTLAIGLRKLHTADYVDINKICGQFNLLAYCQDYLADLNESFTNLQHSLKPILEEFQNDDTAHCVCHNDLVTENCFINDTSAQFIDWEYAQLNNPWFDLAAVIHYRELSSTQARLFLESYTAEFSKQIDQPIFIAAQCAVLWLDILWHAKQSTPTNQPMLQQKLEELQQLIKLSRAA